MRKIHPGLLAGAVVLGLGAVIGLAAFAPSLVDKKPATHQLTLQLPGGGTETITYAGKLVPQVTFRTEHLVSAWPQPLAYSWTLPTRLAMNPVFTDMDRDLDLLANIPALSPALPVQPLGATALSNLPAGTSYAMISQSVGNGVCTGFTQITKAADDAQPKIVSQISGNCGTGQDKASQPGQSTKAVDLRSASGRVTSRT